MNILHGYELVRLSYEKLKKKFSHREIWYGFLGDVWTCRETGGGETGSVGTLPPSLTLEDKWWSRSQQEVREVYDKR